MNTFLKILRIILMIFGVLFLIQLILIAWLWFADPFNIRQALNTKVVPVSESTESQNTNETNEDKNPLLTAEQEAMAESIGIDPASLPSEITAEQEDCLRGIVGEERAQEIEVGSTPTVIEIIKAKSCF